VKEKHLLIVDVNFKNNMIYQKKILALVPARGGSKGIKLKNLKKINNLSLIAHTSNFIDKCKFFDEKILSTDHKKIITEGKKFNFSIIKRSQKLSKDFVSDYDVLRDTLNKKSTFDYVVLLQPTSPIRKVSHIKSALKIVIKKNFHSSWSVSKLDKKFHPLKILEIKKKFLKPTLNKGKKIIARQELRDSYIRNGIFYIFSVKHLLKAKNIYLKKNYPSLTNYSHINIDNLNDLKVAKKMFNKINLT